MPDGHPPKKVTGAGASWWGVANHTTIDYRFKMASPNIRIQIKRRGDTYSMDFAGREGYTAETHIAAAAAVKRAFSDAVDLYLMMDEMSSRTEINNYTWDLKKLRLGCQHKGDAEESVMISLLKQLLVGNGWNVRDMGFELDAAGKVLDPDNFHITVTWRAEATTKPAPAA